MVFGDEEELRELIIGAEVMQPEIGARPKVYYRNIPGQFIGGTVYDPDTEEIIEGVKCRLQSGGKTWITTTDDFGDFWFKDLPVGVFDLAMEFEGFKPYTTTGLKTEQCINLGDMPLSKV